MSTYLSRGTSRVAIALAIAALAAMARMLTTGSAVSRADASVGGPVAIVAESTTLKSTLRLKVYSPAMTSTMRQRTAICT